MPLQESVVANFLLIQDVNLVEKKPAALLSVPIHEDSRGIGTCKMECCLPQ
jgi:hypothetical protein